MVSALGTPDASRLTATPETTPLAVQSIYSCRITVPLELGVTDPLSGPDRVTAREVLMMSSEAMRYIGWCGTAMPFALVMAYNL